MATSKNREIGGVLALGGRRSINKYNNQMEVGVRGGGYIEEEARPGRNVWGGQDPIVFAVKRSVENKEKLNYILALDGCRSKYNQTTTNQKYASTIDNGTKEWYKWGGMQGGLLCIVSVANKRQYIRKNKIIR
jgi:hypothetical protein